MLRIAWLLNFFKNVYFVAVQLQFFPLLLKLIAWNGERYALFLYPSSLQVDTVFFLKLGRCINTVFDGLFSCLFQPREAIFVHSSIDDFSRVISSSFFITSRSALWDFVIYSENIIFQFFNLVTVFTLSIIKKKVVGKKSIIDLGTFWIDFKQYWWLH